MKLTPKMRATVMARARREAASLLEDDWGDPFKHRELPDLPEEAYDAADRHFFKCIAQIAKDLRKGSK